METTEQILSRQYTEFKFRNGQVEYFSISTQHDKANTVEEAINNILEADKKYNGRSPLVCVLDKFDKTGGLLTDEDFESILNIARSYYNLLCVDCSNEV